MRISDWSSDVCSSDLRRRMHRVAAEIAEEVGVLFEDRDGHAGARELEARDHARGTAADDDNRVNVSHINLRSCRAKSRHREVVRSRWASRLRSMRTGIILSCPAPPRLGRMLEPRSEEHTSELQ